MSAWSNVVTPNSTHELIKDAILEEESLDPQLPHLMTPATTLEKLLIFRKICD